MADIKGTIGAAGGVSGGLGPVSGYSATIKGAVGPVSEGIRDGAVTTPKIADEAVTTDKIADAAVTLEKLAAEVIDDTLTVSGAAADAKAVGDALADKADTADVDAIDTRLQTAEGTLSGLGTAATKGVANNLTTASAGSLVLDAYQGKVLNDSLKPAPFTHSSYLSSGDDLNTVGAGVYYCNNSVSNIPVSTGGFVLTLVRTSNAKAQLFLPALSGYTLAIFKRQYVSSSSSWTDWVQIQGAAVANDPIGTYVTSETVSATVASATWTTLTSIAHKKGKYLVSATLSFPSALSSGIRWLLVTSSTGSATSVTETLQYIRTPVTGYATRINVSGIVDATAAGSWFLRAYQTSGSSGTVSGYIRAVKIGD